jgi:ADP-ribosylglycohydrolase
MITSVGKYLGCIGFVLVTFCGDAQDYHDKTKGLLYGTLLGDALGGPIEFYGTDDINKTEYPIKVWAQDEKLEKNQISSVGDKIIFRPYSLLRPIPEPYAMWNVDSAPGTITDDSRNKIVLMYMLRSKLSKRKPNYSEKDLALAYQKWLTPSLIKFKPHYDSLNQKWLSEINFAANWVLENRDSHARPPERMWNSLPTCWGQMTTTPIAALYPNQTEKAYLMAYNLSFFDHSFARDMNAALVAGISHAMSLDPTKLNNEQIWASIIETMKSTDPYRYQDVPWSQRAITKWLTLADTFATKADHKPHALFARLNEEFKYYEKWEAHVVVGVCFSILKICDYDPLAALQMSIEWGWDTDTYPQLIGAFIGAIYGQKIFKDEWKTMMDARLKADYQQDIDEWSHVIQKLRVKGKGVQLWKDR